MRYLTINEVEMLGHEPRLTYGRDVYTFCHKDTHQVIAFDSFPYEMAVSLADFGSVATVPFKFSKLIANM